MKHRTPGRDRCVDVFLRQRAEVGTLSSDHLDDAEAIWTRGRTW